ncbi:MAG: recombination and repair protein RecO protein [Candidatus Magasanikbacteria bacterium GW2011_GWA2_40_10]|uniref:Recombination and repair protein RecO protein n=1 Tax=Candidatus Magasanikbacteria bacterium GW2011_GWA2_40_10 TaxID=1619037 RepID=A0A0G0Q474_9BACT|nr:MAG: recombination and repair protein RecO protein [Candidatus Magasanikbacteria bacterium GW2011_GWA2_40_10]
MLAIVLSRKNIKEFDQMISLYTRELGKVDVLAKGIKKITSKNSANLEILSLVEIEIASGKEVDHLTKVQPIKIFKEIYSDFDKIFIANYAVKLADTNLLTHQPDEKIFNLLLSFLEFLNSALKINSSNLATGFIFKLWHCLGFGLQEEKYQIWPMSSWQEINELNLTEENKKRAAEFACEYAQAHSGQKLAKFVMPC